MVTYVCLPCVAARGADRRGPCRRAGDHRGRPCAGRRGRPGGDHRDRRVGDHPDRRGGGRH